VKKEEKRKIIAYMWCKKWGKERNEHTKKYFKINGVNKFFTCN